MNLRKLSFRRSSKGPVEMTADVKKDASVIRVASCSLEGSSHGNEDRVFCVDDMRLLPGISTTLAGGTERIACATVFDGHGGDRCSDFLVKSLHLRAAANPQFEGFSNAGSVLLDAFKSCEDEWNEIAEREEEFSGSCALACMAMGNDVVLAHAGDCRAVARVGKRTVQLLSLIHI